MSSLLRSASNQGSLEGTPIQTDDSGDCKMDQSSTSVITEPQCLSTQEGLDKHVWKHAEILCLIESMAVHFDDLSNVKKRKNVFENIANDMLSKGFSSNALLCKSKWKSLLRSYSAAVDNKNKTGRGPSRFQFFEEMDAILGTKPSQNCSHTLDTSSSNLEMHVIENTLDDQISINVEPSTSYEESPNKMKKETLNQNKEPNTKCEKAG